MNRAAFCLLISAIICAVSSGCERKPPKKTVKKKYAFEEVFAQSGAPVSLHVRISDSSIMSTDTLTFVLEAQQKDGAQAILPELTDEDFGEFTIRDRKTLRKVAAKKGVSTIATKYILEPFLPGEYVIPPIEVRYWRGNETPADPDETPPNSVRTKEFVIEVKSHGAIDSPSAGIKPIRDDPAEIAEKGTDKKRRAFLILVTIATAALIALVIIMGRRWHPPVAPMRKIPPHETALEALKRLREKRLIERGLIREFYFEISNIMRHYIEGRFSISAPEQTTEEFLVTMTQDGHFDANKQDLLRSFLEHCDLVKFARYAPETGEVRGTFEVTEDFIRQTKQEESESV